MIKFHALKEEISIPKRATKGSAGYDFAASEDILVPSLSRKLIPTDIAAEFPDNMVLELVPRSSLFKKTGFIIPNSPGIIDASFYPRGIMIQVFNLSDEDVYIKKGDKLAQGLFKSIYFVNDEELIEGERTGGFGSTD
jgi:dUTP pyrophosphatase